MADTTCPMCGADIDCYIEHYELVSQEMRWTEEEWEVRNSISYWNLCSEKCYENAFLHVPRSDIILPAEGNERYRCAACQREVDTYDGSWFYLFDWELSKQVDDETYESRRAEEDVGCFFHVFCSGDCCAPTIKHVRKLVV